MKFYVYRRDTGEVVRAGDASNMRVVKIQAREGEVAAAGEAIPRRHRVVHGVLVDHQPPQPSPDHVWDARRWAWVLSSAAREKRSHQLYTQKQIDTLEKKQERAVRELLLELFATSNSEAKDRLLDIDGQISEHRKDLKG